jgi:hypothetical protein
MFPIALLTSVWPKTQFATIKRSEQIKLEIARVYSILIGLFYTNLKDLSVHVCVCVHFPFIFYHYSIISAVFCYFFSLYILSFQKYSVRKYYQNEFIVIE